MGMLLFLVLLCLALGQLTILSMNDNALNWYYSLQKPLWTAPNFVFPLVWTTLYVVMAVSAWLVWKTKKPGYPIALLFWSIQLLFNLLWIVIFFSQQNMLYGLIIIDLLWISVMVSTIFFFQILKTRRFSDVVLSSLHKLRRSIKFYDLANEYLI